MEITMHPELASLIAAGRTADLVAEADARRLARESERNRSPIRRNPFRRGESHGTIGQPLAGSATGPVRS